MDRSTFVTVFGAVPKLRGPAVFQPTRATLSPQPEPEPPLVVPVDPKVPLCVECVWYREDPRWQECEDGWCMRYAEVNPVNGQMESKAKCSVERSRLLGKCGPLGKFFKQFR